MDQQIETTTPIPNDTNTIQTPSKNFPIKTFILIIILAIVAFGLVAIALYGKPSAKIAQITPISATPTLSDPVQATLTVSSSAIKLSTPSAFSSDIIINTGQDSVNKVQLEISYDPKILTKIDINPGTFFTDPQILLKNIDNTNGRISFAIGVQNGNEGILGQGVVARLSFVAAPKNASASVTLLPKTQVSADGYSQSVLKTTVDGFFNFNIAPKLTPTPTKKK
jgi:hypothetical protein